MMNRRKALMALGVVALGVVSGQAKYVKGETYKSTAPEPVDLSSRIIWEMDNTPIIELRMGKEKIEIKTSEIFEALKGGR
jgi:hypothetical protein